MGALRRICAAGLATAGLAPAAAAAAPSQDPWFGEALFHAHQGHYFEALERLDTEIAQHRGLDEPWLDSFFRHIGRAEFSVGDFELHYRMHHRAGRAIRAVIEGDVDEAVRNEAIYRLARIHYQKGQARDALLTLERIEGELPEGLAEDVGFLRANVLLALRRPEPAVKALKPLQGAGSLEGFAQYNLGIALLDAGDGAAAARQLDRAGRISARSPETRAIRDKSNLVLGTLLFEAEEYDLARRSLDRVRLEGPFSNPALLKAGWAEASAENFERALVPWGLLADRDPTDLAVQEALLALPYAYSKLAVHGRAALLYSQAVETFGDEIGKVDASIRSIREGHFLEALAREEIRRDAEWVVRLRSLPEAPETFYLLELMASHDFQTALQNYLDLEDLRRRLQAWRRSLGAFEDLRDRRRRYYEPRLPEIDGRFRELDAAMRLRLEQRDTIAERLSEMLVTPRPELLRSAAEESILRRLARLEQEIDGAAGDDEALRRGLQRRIRRLRGVLAWRLETRYHDRLAQVHGHLRELDQDIVVLQERYDAFVRVRQAATHSYEGYGPELARLEARVGAALDRLEVLQARQGRVLERVAIAELRSRRERLARYQNQARFAFADSYDRASKAQAAAESQAVSKARPTPESPAPPAAPAPPGEGD